MMKLMDRQPFSKINPWAVYGVFVFFLFSLGVTGFLGNLWINNGGSFRFLNTGRGNLASRGRVIQSTGQVTYKDYDKKHLPANIIDGDEKTMWRTQTDLGGQRRTRAVIDLGKIFPVSRASYKVSWDKKSQYDQSPTIRLSYSNRSPVDLRDEKNWTTLSTKTLNLTNHARFVEVRFGKVRARYVRIEYLRDDNRWAGWGNIYELRLHSE